MKRFAAIVLTVLLSVSAQAEVDLEVVDAVLRVTKGIPRDEIIKNHDACDSGVTYPMKICFAYRWMVEDLRMNREYKQALLVAKRVGADQSLRVAQRSWMSFRDAECAFAGTIEAGGGSAEGVIILACKQRITGERADQLTKWASMYSGNRSQ